MDSASDLGVGSDSTAADGNGAVRRAIDPIVAQLSPGRPDSPALPAVEAAVALPAGSPAEDRTEPLPRPIDVLELPSAAPADDAADLEPIAPAEARPIALGVADADDVGETLGGETEAAPQTAGVESGTTDRADPAGADVPADQPDEAAADGASSEPVEPPVEARPSLVPPPPNPEAFDDDALAQSVGLFDPVSGPTAAAPAEDPVVLLDPQAAAAGVAAGVAAAGVGAAGASAAPAVAPPATPSARSVPPAAPPRPAVPVVPAGGAPPRRPAIAPADPDSTGEIMKRPQRPARPLQQPVAVRRPPRSRVRRVTRVVRSLDTWSVFKVAAIFNLFMLVVTLTTGVLLWKVAVATGTIDNVERGFENVGWQVIDLKSKGGEIFRNALIAGLFVAIGLTGLAVMLATLFNLITDLVGGIRVTVLEEEVRTKDERPPMVVQQRPGQPVGQPTRPAVRQPGAPPGG